MNRSSPGAPTSLRFFLLLLLLLLLSTSISPVIAGHRYDNPGQAPIKGQTFEHHLARIRTDAILNRQENYTPHSHSQTQWDYTGVTGPLGWTNLSPTHNKDCSTSNSQSPINIDESMAPNYFNYKWNAPKSYCYNMTNDGHGIFLRPCSSSSSSNVGTGKRNVQDKKGNDDDDEEWFTLSHISLHSPSEHRFLGEHFPLEAQFVMKNTHTGRYRIRSVLFDVVYPGKKPSSFFDGIYPHLPAVAKKGSFTVARDVNTVDLMRVFQKAGLAGQVYNYKGSLTTPPCTPGVEWDVLSDPLYVTVETYLVVKAIVRFNARYTQNTVGKENLLQVACHIKGGGNR